MPNAVASVLVFTKGAEFVFLSFLFKWRSDLIQERTESIGLNAATLLATKKHRFKSEENSFAFSKTIRTVGKRIYSIQSCCFSFALVSLLNGYQMILPISFYCMDEFTKAR